MMTIDEAIKSLAEYYCKPLRSPTLAQLAAMKLGIEALKRENERRHYYINSSPDLLLGETEESQNDS